jgi:hypothetical protein
VLFLQVFRTYGAGCDVIARGCVPEFYVLSKRHSPFKVAEFVGAVTQRSRFTVTLG